MTSNPNRFATWFNIAHPDAYRRITAEDVEDMKSCELIHRYGFYSSRLDGITVIGILKYEKLREKRATQQPAEAKQELQRCKRCGQLLPPEPEDRMGRPRLYCPGCQCVSNKERQKKFRRQHRKHHK